MEQPGLYRIRDLDIWKGDAGLCGGRLHFEYWDREFSGTYRLATAPDFPGCRLPRTTLHVKTSNGWLLVTHRAEFHWFGSEPLGELRSNWPDLYEFMKTRPKGVKLSTGAETALRRRVRALETIVKTATDSGNEEEGQQKKDAVKEYFHLRDGMDLMSRKLRGQLSEIMLAVFLRTVADFRNMLSYPAWSPHAPRDFELSLGTSRQSFNALMLQACRTLLELQQCIDDNFSEPSSGFEAWLEIRRPVVPAPSPPVAHITAAPPRPPPAKRSRLSEPHNRKTKYTISEDLSGNAGMLKKLSILREKPSLLEWARVNRNGKRLRNEY